jgi:sec-independent protein translocase protein TatC
MAVANPEDDIDQTKAPLLDHLIELRRRLIYCVITIFVFFILCYVFAQDLYNFLLIPYRLAVGGETRIDMIYTAPQEFFFTQLRVSLFGALALSFPMLAAQLYMFVAPGLYRNERQAFLPYLVATPILFILGAALVFFVVMPLAMRFFLSMQQTGDAQVHIQLTARVSEYLYLITTLIMGFGICFQLPVVLTLLARVGLVTSQWLRQQWRYAVVIIFAVAAFLTPPDVMSQVGLAIPTLLLYELSIFAVRIVERQKAAAEKQRAESEGEDGSV